MGSAASADLEKHREMLEDLDRLTQKQTALIKHSFQQRESGAITHRTTTEAEVLARNIPHGSRVALWKQDPSVTRIGVRKAYLPHIVRPGPSDDDIEVVLELTTKSGKVEKDTKCTAVASPDANHDFLPDVEGDSFAFDLVHTYTVARLTLDMYIRDLKIDWKWVWDRDLAKGQPKTPLRIICHAGEKPNAVYHRGKKCLKFYYLTKESKTVYLCRSFDVVAHETGHAILDALKPKLYSVHSGQSGALHESFGDLTAIFSALNQLDLCEDIIAETKGDLRKADYITAIGEQFAAEMKGGDNDTETTEEDEKDDDEHQETAGMRNANNDLTGHTAGKDMYQLANVFSGFVWDVLVAIFNWERDPHNNETDSETLLRVGRAVRRILLLGLFNSPDVPDFVDLARGMDKAVGVIAESDPGDVDKYRSIIREMREKRKLSDAGRDKKPERLDLGDF